MTKVLYDWNIRGWASTSFVALMGTPNEPYDSAATKAAIQPHASVQVSKTELIVTSTMMTISSKFSSIVLIKRVTKLFSSGGKKTNVRPALSFVKRSLTSDVASELLVSFGQHADFATLYRMDHRIKSRLMLSTFLPISVFYFFYPLGPLD
jgi:hypothetical protein